MPNGCVSRGAKKFGSCGMDDEGYRTYSVTFLVVGSYDDGPANAMLARGLPDWGDQYEIKNDVDIWAFAGWKRTVTSIVDKEPNRHFDVEIEFSSKPSPLRCKQEKVDNPLLTPDRISGGGVHYTEEATRDRFGFALVTSSMEQLRGPQVEFDRHREDVKIGQNRAALELTLFTPMQNTVNDRPLWGFPARCIKLKQVRWEQKFYARCAVYYERNLEFEINVIRDPLTGSITSGWDRNLIDEGTKVLHGHWDKKTGEWVLDNINGQLPNPVDPRHFDRFKDKNGENCKVVLNGSGLPAGVSVNLNGPFYVNIGGASGKPPGTGWALVVGGLVPVAWDEDTQYAAGTVVIIDTEAGDVNTYIAIHKPAVGEEPPSANWAFLAKGVNNQGVWKPGVSYTIGDAVRPSLSTGVGIIHVEEYDESNFLLLGIPLTIG